MDQPPPKAARRRSLRRSVRRHQRGLPQHEASGGDVRAVLEAGFRDRGPDRVEPGRLGAATWGMGRGAAPPRFGYR